MKKINRIEDLYYHKFNLKEVYEKNLEIEGMELFLFHKGYKIYCLTLESIKYKDEFNDSYLKRYIGDTKESIDSRWHSNLMFNSAHFYNYDNIINSHKPYSRKYNSMRKYGLDKFSLMILPHDYERDQSKDNLKLE
jgi:hypothetical protein